MVSLHIDNLSHDLKLVNMNMASYYKKRKRIDKHQACHTSLLPRIEIWSHSTLSLALHLETVRYANDILFLDIAFIAQQIITGP